MLSPQAGAVLLNTFLSMHKKCFNYFELNWKFICKRVIFKNINIALARTANGFWALKKKKKKTPLSALTCVAGGIRVDVFPFFSRPIAKFVPLVLSASYAGYQRIQSLSADPEFWPTASLIFSLRRSEFKSSEGEHLLHLGLVLPHQQSSLLLLINRKIWASFLLTFVPS